ncbi:MAG: hypothetical protein MUE73_04040, partial [Planctomycetes bacterium]|nr:hypothetical protein [Planctomycetota bacterium]
MLELAKHPEGKITLLWRPEPERPAVRIAGALAAGLGFLLLFTPMAGRSPSEVALLLPAQALLLLAGVRLLASILRRGRLASSLHVASGELEVRAGRGPLSARRAFGAVDADHLLLTGETAGETRQFRLAVITRAGPPVLLCGDEPDEE